MARGMTSYFVWFLVIWLVQLVGMGLKVLLVSKSWSYSILIEMSCRAPCTGPY